LVRFGTRAWGRALPGGVQSSTTAPAAGFFYSSARPPQRSFMSTQPVSMPEDESTLMLILGKPGGGKGTISGKILQVRSARGLGFSLELFREYSTCPDNPLHLLCVVPQDFPRFHHVSTGDLLRQHVREKTALGQEAKKYMDTGKLVPDDIMIDLVMGDATPYMEEGRNLLLDGFPRTLNQATSLEKVAHIDMVINLDIPTETIVDRIADRYVPLLVSFLWCKRDLESASFFFPHERNRLFRWIHPASGRVYSYSYNPPKVRGKDDVTGEDLVQRDDDKPECVRKRLAAYDEVSLEDTIVFSRWLPMGGVCFDGAHPGERPFVNAERLVGSRTGCPPSRLTAASFSLTTQLTAPLIRWYDKKGVLKSFSGTMSDVIYPEVKEFLKSKQLD